MKAKGIGSATLLALMMVSAHAQTPVVIREILVRGNERISTDVIRATMRSAEGRPLNAAELERDQTSLRNLGFFKTVQVFTREVSATEVQVVVDVEENPVIKEISVIGNTVVSTEDILKVVSQQTDQVLNLNSRKQTSDAVRELYSKRGYFADVDFPVQEDAPNTLVVMVIETTVNDIVITGASKTKPFVFDLLMRTKPGQPFNQRTWGSDYRRLATTQWFSDVRASERPTGEIGRFDLLLDVKEQRTAVFDIGAALDPRSRLAGTLRVRDTNFRGRGQQLGASWMQDTFGSGASVSLDFTDPFMFRSNTELTASVFSRVNSNFNNFGGNSNLNDDARFDERRTGANLGLTRTYRQKYSLTGGISFEDIRTVNQSTGNNAFIQQDGQLYKFLIQGTSDTRDVPLEPFSGSYARIAFEPGFSDIKRIGGAVSDSPQVLGSNTYLKTSLEYRTFYSKAPKPRPGMTDEERIRLETKARPVLAARVKAGTIKGIVPFFEQYFAGGSDTIRGYDEQRFWGRNTLVSTVELRYPIQDNFNVVGFVDYGGAWGGYSTIDSDGDGSLLDERFTQSDRLNLHFGYGLGVGFKTPLGSIRIDFGFTPKGNSRTHFTIGSTF